MRWRRCWDGEGDGEEDGYRRDGIGGERRKDSKIVGLLFPLLLRPTLGSLGSFGSSSSSCRDDDDWLTTSHRNDSRHWMVERLRRREVWWVWRLRDRFFIMEDRGMGGGGAFVVVVVAEEEETAAPVVVDPVAQSVCVLSSTCEDGIRTALLLWVSIHALSKYLPVSREYGGSRTPGMYFSLEELFDLAVLVVFAVVVPLQSKPLSM